MQGLYSPAVIQRLLKTYGLRPNKALGQNFLADLNTIKRIIRTAEISPEDVVLEIGPGLGSLTEGLLHAGARVIAIEKDAGLVRVLQEVFASSPHVEIVHGDALKTDLAALVRPHTERRSSLSDDAPSVSPVKIVANLPYYITSPLLMHLLESDLAFERAVVMIQREVALRLVAKPGTKEYGALTVAVQYRAQVELAGSVPPTVFVPAPAVTSEIVLLKPVHERLAAGSSFFALVKAAFAQRRKTLKNALRALGLGAGEIEAALKAAGIAADRRGETLSVDEFARLSQAMDDQIV